jgi:hypothetical protein
MINRIETEPDIVRVICVPLKLLFEIEVFDLRENVEIIAAAPDGYLVIKIAVNKGSIGKEPAIENMIPTDGACAVTPL